MITNQACWSLTCDNLGSLSGTVRPDMFGISMEDVDQYVDEQLTLNDGSCVLVFDADLKVFKFDTLLNNCGVEAGHITEDGNR